MKRRAALIKAITATMVLALVLVAACGSRSGREVPPIVFFTPTDNSSGVLALSGIEVSGTEPDADGVRLISVGLSADAIYIKVTFAAVSPDRVKSWGQGSIYLVDESSGTVYRDVPIVPVLGALFGRPQSEGQTGYAMLANNAPGVGTGSVVTVVLGRFKREHVVVF